MALRIRLDGRIFCAALNEEEEDDVYIDDDLHYELSVVKKVLVTTENWYHMANGGEWWWKGREPKDVPICWTYYDEDPPQTHGSTLQDIQDYCEGREDFISRGQAGLPFLYTWRKRKVGNSTKARKVAEEPFLTHAYIHVFPNKHPKKRKGGVKIEISGIFSDLSEKPLFKGWVESDAAFIIICDAVGVSWKEGAKK